MTPPVSTMWVLLKGGVFRNEHRTVDDLKRNINNETAAIPSAVLAVTFPNMERRVGLYLQAVRAQF
jgi:hypothetical protein